MAFIIKNVKLQQSTTSSATNTSNDDLAASDSDDDADGNRPAVVELAQSSSDNSIDKIDTDRLIKLSSSSPPSPSPSPSQCRNILLHMADISLSSTLFLTLVSLYWYSTWSLLDKYWLPGNLLLSNSTAYAVSILFLLASYLFQRDLHDLYIGRMRGSHLMLIAYMYLISLVIVCEWRSLWNLIDEYVDQGPLAQLLTSLAIISVFCATRSTNNLVSVPFILYKDDKINPFTTDSRLKLKRLATSRRPYLQYLFDFVLVELFECFALVTCWRCSSNLLNHLIQLDTAQSLVTLFALSHLLYLTIIVFKWLIVNACSRRQRRLLFCVNELLNVLMFIDSILFWEFYWCLFDTLTRTLDSRLSLAFLLLSHLMCIVLSLLLKTVQLLSGPASSLSDNAQPKLGLDPEDQKKQIKRKEEIQFKSIFEIGYFSERNSKSFYQVKDKFHYHLLLLF